MKTLKLITCIILVSACSSFAQVTPTPTPTPATPATPASPASQQGMKPMDATQTQVKAGQEPLVAGQPAPRMSRFMVTIPHTKEQCQVIMNQMKEKGTPIMMRFDWGCASGEHIGYAMLGGQDVDGVRKQLPEGVQKIAKITKVDKANAAQMEQMHK